MYVAHCDLGAAKLVGLLLDTSRMELRNSLRPSLHSTVYLKVIYRGAGSCPLSYFNMRKMTTVKTHDGAR